MLTSTEWGGIHRDLKPQNILIDHLGRVMLADFGLATLEVIPSKQIASIEGTERYMAPEQRWNRLYGRSTDCWALGCIYYLELLTFGRNISRHYFENFRRIHGSQSCQPSKHTSDDRSTS